ncbi:unnamed protein product [Rotaria sordida]|uniref:EF-hand domain-containing protein n=2 Tax=Rotaria sordida TaxID=392033 RepID=A0A815BNF5_9BILA|nr:unnamed protein product [Rotaria sordida]CAF1554306.1 unnamed protein product [Rotaria sordida]
MAKLTPSQERELRDAFDLFDSDHSGKISKTELRQVLKALNIAATDAELQKLMAQMDTNRSGDIDYNEFKNVMAKSFFRKYSRKELLDAFKNFDTDGNGYITTNELDNILSRMGRHLTRPELESMISSLDTSGDGKVSFEEFCRLFD